MDPSATDLAALAAALILAAVLTVAAVAKLRRPEGTAADFAALGLPASGVLASVVPLVELVCAIVLVVLPGWGGVAAFGLLAAFTSLLIGVLRSGRVVSCSCFGATDRDPVSVRHLVRNAVLGLLAIVASTFGGGIWQL